MTLNLILPGLFAVAVSALLGLVPLPLHPRTTMRVLSIVAAVAATTTLLILVIAATGFVVGSAVMLSLISWCPFIPLHHEITLVQGLGSITLLALVGGRALRVLRRHRRAVDGTAGQRLSILDTSQPIAFAAPGKPGCVVVSNGLLGALNPQERKVVFAHERAHLVQNHHRYLMTIALARVVVPLLGPLASRVRLATERCADEAAVLALAGDREVVATSIARAALVTSEFAGSTVGSFGGGSVPKRIESLVGNIERSRFAALATGSALAGLGLAATASSIQLHHFAQLVGHICGR